MTILFENIKYLCEKSNIKIKDLEIKLNISNGQIGKWRHSSPSVYKVKEVANYFGVTIDSLVSGNGYQNFSNSETSTFDLNYISDYANLTDSEKEKLKSELIDYLSYKVYTMRKV